MTKMRFRQVELAGDRLHLLRRQIIGAKHHRQRISAEAAVGENIKGVEGKQHEALNNMAAARPASQTLSRLSRLPRTSKFCHPGESRGPGLPLVNWLQVWVPAFAGMTEA